MELTGLEATNVNRLVVFSSYSSNDGRPVIVRVFSCQVEDKHATPQKDEEILDAEFRDLNGLKRSKLRNDIVEKAIKMNSESKLLPVNRFEGYKHPFMPPEPSLD